MVRIIFRTAIFIIFYLGLSPSKGLTQGPISTDKEDKIDYLDTTYQNNYWQKNQDVPWHRLGGNEVLEQLVLKDRRERGNALFFLRQAKFSLISGNWELAEKSLSQITQTHGSSFEIAQRYKSLLFFARGDYQKVVEIISPQIFSSTTFLRQSCLIYLYSLMATNQQDLMPIIWQPCRRETEADSPNNLLMMEAMLGIHLDQPYWGDYSFLRSSAPFYQNEEMIKSWLKLGLILGKEKEMEQELSELGEHSYFKDKIRELVAIALFRLGRIEDAMKFIEDIQTPNAENLRGIALLKNKQWENAYAHFISSLKIKENSLQALNRALPLAWLLKQDKSGLELIQKLPATEVDRQEKDLIEAAFLNRLGRYEESYVKLRHTLEKKGHRSSPLTKSLELINELELGKMEFARDLARGNCEEANPLSCWLLLTLSTWENFPKLLHREEKKLELGQWHGLDELLNSTLPRPLKDDILIEQSRLNEMDLGTLGLEQNLAPYDQKELFLP